MSDPEQITFFAKTDARGQEVPFGIKAKDRTRHIYVIGKTGMGKSTLLENMAVQDIKNGNGLAFIDPHGQTAETILDYIPEERKDDVIYFAPFDTENPISFNVMEDVGADKRHLVVSGLMSVFKKIWVDAWSARMEYILSNTLLALLEYPDSTLLGVNRMLSDKDYRMRVIENITDPAVKSFWVDEFLKYNERYMQEAGDAIKNKIGQFTSNPLIRNIIGQPHSSFDIRKIMDEKKILIMNLSKGLVGEQNANLLGSMLTTRIYLAAMSRADRSAAEMKDTPNFYFYVDEFQSFANATFADILSEARKYKLNLTIAHQYIEQMEEEVRNAVFGNVGTIISFRVGPFDAEVLETVYTPTFLAPDIVNLGFAQIYLTLMIDGIGSQPFSASTLPPIELSGESCKNIVIKNSQMRYAQKREGVETTIHAWHDKKFDNKPPYIPKHLREGADTADDKKPEAKTSGNNAYPRTNASTGKPASGDPARASAPQRSNNAAGKPVATNSDRTSASPRKEYNQRPHSRNQETSPSGNRNDHAKPTEASSARNRNDYSKSDETPREKVKDSRPVRNDEFKKDREGAPAKTPQRREVKNEKSLDDLRAVLRNLTGDAHKSSEVEKKVDSKQKNDSQKNDTHAKQEPSLKDALAAALGNAEGKRTDIQPSEVQDVSKNSPEHTKTSQTELQERSHKRERGQTQEQGHQEKVNKKVSENRNQNQHNNADRIKQQSSGNHRNNNSHSQEDKEDSVPQNHQTDKSKNTQGNTPNTPSSEKKPQQEISEKSQHTKSVSLDTKEHTQATPGDTLTDSGTYAQMKNIDDPLAPKKLERMMRVTTSDKPPIK